MMPLGWPGPRPVVACRRPLECQPWWLALGATVAAPRGGRPQPRSPQGCGAESLSFSGCDENSIKRAACKQREFAPPSSGKSEVPAPAASASEGGWGWPPPSAHRGPHGTRGDRAPWRPSYEGAHPICRAPPYAAIGSEGPASQRPWVAVGAAGWAGALRALPGVHERVPSRKLL